MENNLVIVYTKHGLEYEPIARKVYEDLISSKVVECGLIVSKENQWLACSPDGILFLNNKPFKLIEIKCPYEGRKRRMSEVINTIKWLERKNDQLTLKQRHAYYAQIQISMAILNLQSTDFIIYTPFDNNLITLSISFDEEYAKDILWSLKKIYFDKMIHFICEKKREED